jgi:L-ascorbate metabolism protein UlaG (beta-lactamase superfamily)
MLIKWHGHSCFEIIAKSPLNKLREPESVELKNSPESSILRKSQINPEDLAHGKSYFRKSIIWVTDPHDGKSLGLKKPGGQADFITISHRHFDHDKARFFKTEKTKIIHKPGRIHYLGVETEGLETFHDMSRGKERGKNILFSVSINRIRLVHMGDLGHKLIPGELAKLHNIDIIFIPVGGIFTIGPKVAWNVISEIKPRVAVPMHYNLPGLSLPLKEVEDFLSLAPAGCQIEKVGKQKKIDRKILDTHGVGSTKIWVFSIS